MRGYPIKRSNIPEAFWAWYDELEKEYPFVQLEVNNDEISVCRVRILVDSMKEIKNIPFGKIVKDAKGCYLEKTFIPRYFPQDKLIRCL